VLSPLIRRAAEPTRAQDQQLAVARRQRALRQHVVAEHEPALQQLRVVRERGEDVERAFAEQCARLVVPVVARERLHTRFHEAAAYSAQMPADLRADTMLTPDPTRPGRLHGEIPEDWKVVYVFGGVSMYAALRAMQEALGRPDLDLVTANAIFLAPVPPGPITVDVEVLRNGRRASQVAGDLRVPGVEGVALRAHGVFGAAHDTDLEHQEVVFPEVSLPVDTPIPDITRPNPFGVIPFHQQTEWRPVSPLDDPGKGQFLSWVR